MAPRTDGAVRPSAPACMKPSMRVATARNSRTAPTMSRRGWSGRASGAGREMRARAPNATTARSRPGTNTHGQPMPCTMAPASMGPTVVTSIVIAKALPVAAPR